MYKINTVKDQPAHSEGYKDDKIVCFASAHTEFIQKTIDWIVPKCLKNDFETFIYSELMEDERDKNIWGKYKNWFTEKLLLKTGSIHINDSKRYFSRYLEYEINDDNIKYNKKDCKIKNIKCNDYDIGTIYNNIYERDYTAAYIIDNQIIAMVSANEDGQIEKLLPSMYVDDKTEYIIPCIKKLVNEFKMMKKKIYLNVYSFERPEEKIVKLMEMEWRGINYHFLFDDGFYSGNDKDMVRKLYEK